MHATVEAIVRAHHPAAVVAILFAWPNLHCPTSPGVTRRHSRIALNIARKLADASGDSPCRVHQRDMQVPTPDGPWYYPDLVVACGAEPDAPYIEDAPCALVEILSPTTESIDRREKLLAYRRIQSLQAHLLVEQDRRMVECHYRADDGVWRNRLTDDGTIDVPCLNTALSLLDLYAGA